MRCFFGKLSVWVLFLILFRTINLTQNRKPKVMLNTRGMAISTGSARHTPSHVFGFLAGLLTYFNKLLLVTLKEADIRLGSKLEGRDYEATDSTLARSLYESF